MPTTKGQMIHGWTSTRDLVRFTGSGVVLIGGWAGVGVRFSGHWVSVGNGEKVLEGEALRSHGDVNLLGAFELHTSKCKRYAVCVLPQYKAIVDLQSQAGVGTSSTILIHHPTTTWVQDQHCAMTHDGK